MWEKPRVDGKKKLKVNSVPTIFPLPKHIESQDFCQVYIYLIKCLIFLNVIY